MPVTPTYPGVYIEEIPSGVRTITPVATSITAFIGPAPRGLADEPVTIRSFADYERKFGGLLPNLPMSYAVKHYFDHGGSTALIVRVTGSEAASAQAKIDNFPLQAASPGEWGNGVRVRIEGSDFTKKPEDKRLFNLLAYEPLSRTVESFRNVSVDQTSDRYVKTVLQDESSILRAGPGDDFPAEAPKSSEKLEKPNLSWFADANASGSTKLEGGKNGNAVEEKNLIGGDGEPQFEQKKRGLYALENAEIFNLLCIPPLPPAAKGGPTNISNPTLSKALEYASRRRAMLIVDPSFDWKEVDQGNKGIDQLRKELGGEELTRNAAAFFPLLKMADPLKEGRLGEFVPCGAVAGIFARTDVQRGVWKSPAGLEAGFRGVREFTVPMTDLENGDLNVKGMNCLRFFRAYGNVIWGSRTVAGSDQLGSEWKYIAVRRFALFLEESLYRGTQWVVFEPNDEPLWAQIRLNIGAFMQNLFRQGALQGRTPRDAYFVKCDNETTTQNDINRGIVNIEVGFAPLKPAEFVILKFQQIAGKIET